MRPYKIVVFSAIAMMFSCTFETSDNGDLDGFWHLERVDTLSTGGSCDMSERLVFWSVQMDLMNVADYKNNVNGYIMRFDHTGSLFRIYEPYVNDRMEEDPKVEDVQLLVPFGINALDETFTINRLTGSDMTLSTDELRLYFHKM